MKLLRSVGIMAAVGSLSLILGNVGLGQQGGRGGLGSQSTSANAPSRPPSQVPDMSPLPSATPAMVQEQAKMRNNDRQKQLVLDTQRLLALANELKSDVDKSNKDTLSLDVIRKADEIEKLARSVKEKMKGS